MRFFEELKRRNVIRAALAYLAGCWLIVQILETLFPIFGLPETRIRWVVIALGVLAVPFLVLAWLYEWTEHGIRREADLDHAPESVRRRERRFERLIIALLSVALASLALERFVIRPALEQARVPVTASVARPPTIAVLPFADLSPGQDQAWFADGLAEELLNLLAKIPELRVTARTSSFSFKGSNLPITEIATALGVAHVLEGSVRSDGDRIRVTAQLISAEDGYHLWSETYDGPAGDVFGIQEAIAREIVAALKPELLGGWPEIPEPLPQAHVLFLQGLYLQRQGNPDAMLRAEEFFRRAVELDPDYAAAWVALGTTLANQAAHGVKPWDEGHEMAREAVQRALESDPDNGAAHGQLAWLAHAYDGDLRAAARHAERALELAPTDVALIGNAAVLLQSLGRLDDAIALHEYGLAREPLDPVAWYNAALAYYFAHRLDDAERHLRRLLELSPEYAGARYRLGTILLIQGKAEAALATFEQEADEAYRVKGRALALYSLGRSEEANAALRELTEKWGETWPSEVAQVHAWRGELDQAFEWLEKDYALTGPAGWGEWRLMLLYDNLRADPRWQAFLERAGVSDAQLAAIHLRVTFPPVD
jgi:TolB-like protein/Tfp pilus assembly protein PilF